MTDVTPTRPLPAPPADPDSLGREVLHQRLHGRLFGAIEAPIRVGRFLVIDTLGRGGMGAVYSAMDERLDRRVAIKLIRSPHRGPHEQARLLAEARAQARLSHPNVVQVHEVGESGDDVFIVMELIHGVTLDRWLERERSLPDLLAVFRAAGRGLTAAHAAGLMHRDVKPGNILIGADGRVCLADFGLAREHTSDGSAHQHTGDTPPPRISNAAAGTPAYMAPEQARGQPEPRSDQYSFCVTLYEALHRERPFPDEPGPPNGSPTSAPRFARKVPRWLRRLLTRGLSPHPADRFPSMQALLTALERRPSRGRPLWLGLGAVLSFAATFASAWWLAAPPPTCPFRSEHNPEWILNRLRGPELQRSFHATGIPGAPEAWIRLRDGVERFIARWQSTSEGVCEAVQEFEALRYATECLDRQLVTLANLLEAYAFPDSRELARLDEAIAGLPEPAVCHDPTLRDRPQMNIRLQERLDRAAQVQRGGDTRTALGLLTELEARSSAENSLAGLAEVLFLRAKIEAPEPIRAEKTLRDASEAAAAGHRDLLWKILNAQAHLSAQEFQDSVRARDQLNLARAAVPPSSAGDPLVNAALLDTEGYIAINEGEYADALRIRREALQLRQHLPEHSPELARSRVAVANAAGELGHLLPAQAELMRLLAEHQRRFGERHPVTAHTELSAALNYSALGRYTEARRLLQHHQDILVELEGSSSPRVATSELNLARIAQAEGKRSEATRRGLRALSFFAGCCGPEFSERLATLLLLVELARRDRHWDQALAWTQQLLEVHRKGKIDLDLSSLLTTIGDSLCQLGRCKEAGPYYNELLFLAAPARPDHLELEAHARQGLGQVFAARGDLVSAQHNLEDALNLLNSDPEHSDPMLIQTQRHLATVLKRRGREPARVRRLLARADAAERAIGEALWQ